MVFNIDELIKTIEKKLESAEGQLNELSWHTEDDFDPMDASGGNFDDAYYMGYEYGDVQGEFNAYHDILDDLKKLKGDR